MKDKIKKRLRRKFTIRKKVSGNSEKPRVTVFRSNKHTYAQLINDDAQLTITSVNDKAFKVKGKTSKAKEIGLELAKIMKSKKIEKGVFDRNGYKYHGRVKAVADGLREGGIII